MRKYLFISLILFSINALGQNKILYDEIIEEAEILYFEKDYVGSAEKFREAILSFESLVEEKDLFNAAASFSLANDKEGAFEYIEMLLEREYSNYDSIAYDLDFNNLKEDSRWEEYIEEIEQNLENKLNKIDNELQKKVLNVRNKLRDYQEAYRDLGEILKDSISNEEKMFYYNDYINCSNEQHKIIMQILDKEGFIKEETIGKIAFYQILNSLYNSPYKYQKKFLDNLKEEASNYKYYIFGIEDQIHLFEKGTQNYGTQFFYDKKNEKFQISPIENIEELDNLRYEAGMKPIKEYYKNWTKEEYIKNEKQIIKAYQLYLKEKEND